MDGTMLSAAIHIYQQAGFKLISEEQAHRFGVDMVDQIWELAGVYCECSPETLRIPSKSFRP